MEGVGMYMEGEEIECKEDEYGVLSPVLRDKDGKKKSLKKIQRKPLSEETRQKLSIANRGKPKSEECLRSLRRLGEKNLNAKLAEAQVREIKIALADGETCTSLGRKFRVSRSIISEIKHGRAWAWLEVAP